jgi:DNA mismatch repair protein MutS
MSAEMVSSQQLKKEESTPLMQQYFAIKQEHTDALLLFQVGDFYELFFDDAKRAAAVLGIALTARGKNKGEPIPLCGVPVHAIDHYINRLIKAGFKVALCSQLEEAVPGRVVLRGVTQVLTPGTLTDGRLLDEKTASYLMSFFEHNGTWGLLFGELLTAQLFATTIDASAGRLLEAELSRFLPDEIIIPQSKECASFQTIFKKYGYFVSVVPVQEHAQSQWERIEKSFLSSAQPQGADDFKKQEALRLALCYFHAFVAKNQPSALDLSWHMQLYNANDFLQLDAATQKNLELVVSCTGSKTNTLFQVLDQAVTPMGSRLLKKWLLKPLLNQQAIEQRLDAVEIFKTAIGHTHALRQTVQRIGDIERIVGRIALRRATLHDYVSLGHCLTTIPAIVDQLKQLATCELFIIIAQYLEHFEPLAQLLSAACNTDTTKDYSIAECFNAELDTVREVIQTAHERLLVFESEQQKRTGISSLKVGFNTIHGYYVEITKTHLAHVPSDYIRYQTLVGKERYVTPQLQHMYSELLEARMIVKKTEERVFNELKNEVSPYIPKLRRLAHALAHADVLLSLAYTAHQGRYVRPVFNQGHDMVIEQGRHPVVEYVSTGSFIPNDTVMNDASSLCIITGPNMGGKSTYLRQVALINLLAQCGSFVPARRAQLALRDRIFTRIGAGDNLAQGKSTFLIEMEETATICEQATAHSLIILDEVGRGTSTIDGLAIAQAVVEYLYTYVGARCLFATHYHELTTLSTKYPGIVNYYAASKPTQHGILFLYKIVPGVADGSFGVQVAQTAHLPPFVITRAKELVRQFSQEKAYTMPLPAAVVHEISEPSSELVFLRNIAQQLNAINCDDLSPRQAHEFIAKLQKDVIEVI